MRQYFLKAIGLVAMISFVGTQGMAQEARGKEQLSDNDEIVIRKRGDKNSKVTVEINNGEVKVNGKPLSEFDDDNVTIRKRKSGGPARIYGPGRSPFQGGAWNFDENEGMQNSNANRAFLGVRTEKEDNGAKISSVTKGSSADKAGLKEGDVITKVDDSKIESPEDLSETIGKYKPEDKATITYRRDKKEQKANVVLSRRTGGPGNLPENFNYNRNFDFDFTTPEFDGMNFMLRGGGPRLGIKAQDTEDGKGVKVLDVDDASNAEKAGIKEGDILTEFDGKAVNSATELMEAAKSAKEKNSIKIKLTRDGKSQEVEVTISKKLKTANL